ncbi:FGGY-family carbohydrate kinase [Nocardioides sp. SOB77]|uniref:FGGY-family carbohydrate kinase n=1 Tax=Nocardioides oceani TaxID=3058369 RepID=A0ABT8FI53_9ACTN|nr:FGGY-family carbohydrate kinase [Nocardioides oceani]MDN4174205.1 FGGY-family carbohydrate kinase [Nocardioides oceani]
MRTKPSSAITRSTRSRVPGLTRSGRFSTFETVPSETPAAAATSLRVAAELAGRAPTVVHVVGGGSQNHLLCQLTADATGLPVLAGPSEAAALGNVLVQARSLGAQLPDLAAMRDLVRRTHELHRFEPRPGLDWDAAEQRLLAGDVA